MLNATPAVARVITPNLRGYVGSSPWIRPNDIPPEQRQARLGHDYAAIINWVVHEMVDNQDENSRIVILGWSLGCLGIISAYHLLATGRLNEAEQETLNHRIAKVILYEPPSRPVFSTASDATRDYYDSCFNNPQLSRDERVQMLLEYLTGVWHYDQNSNEWLDDPIRLQKEVFKYTKSLCLEPEFQSKYFDGVWEPAVIPMYLGARAQSSETLHTFHAMVLTALQALVDAPGVEMVQGLTSTTSPPQCINGTLWVFKEVQRIQNGEDKVDGASSSKRKAVIDFVDGPYGHYTHALVPNVFWERITRR